MEDSRILDLYRTRAAEATVESDAVYGQELRRIARNILENGRDADLCVADALELAREVIPATSPDRIHGHLGAHLACMTRNLALERYREHIASRRGSHQFAAILNELATCTPAGSTGFGTGFDDEAEARMVGDAVNRFLKKQPGEAREIFLCRYFYAESIGEITTRFGLTERQVIKKLSRTREKLRLFLENEGVRL